MTRKQAMEIIRVAGYHNDTQTMTRTWLNNRISRTAAIAAYRVGQHQREAGVRCTCYECQVWGERPNTIARHTILPTNH